MLSKFFANRIESFLFGILAPFNGLKLILKNPTLLVWTAIPILITAFASFYLVDWLQSYSQKLLNSQLQNHLATLTSLFGEKLIHWLIKPIQWILNLIIILTISLCFSMALAIISSPFNDFLAEATEKKLNLPPPLVPKNKLLQHQTQLFILDFIKSSLATLTILAAFFLSWVPVLNIIAFTLAALMATFQFVGYAQTRRSEKIIKSFYFLGRHFFLCFGFGLTISFLLAIPVIGGFFIPLAVTGGTLVYWRATSTGESKSSKK